MISRTARNPSSPMKNDIGENAQGNFDRFLSELLHSIFTNNRGQL
jgi:hypothetical protein